MGLFTKKVELTDQEIADELASSGLGLFTQARDNLTRANEINEKIVVDAVENTKAAGAERDEVIEAAKVRFTKTLEDDGAKIASAQAAKAQNERALEALSRILGA